MDFSSLLSMLCFQGHSPVNSTDHTKELAVWLEDIIIGFEGKFINYSSMR